MFSQKLKDWIYDNVKDDYSGDIANDTIAFEKSLCLSAKETSLEGINTILPNVLEEMSEASSIGALQGLMEGFIKVEPYLRHLFSILYPERFKKMPKEEVNGLEFTDWTLAPLLKQAFRIIPMNYNLSSKRPTNCPIQYKSYYDLIYDKRNDSAHNYSNMKQKEVFELISACLVVYLDIAGRLCLQIEEAFSKEKICAEFSALQYCQQIVRTHKNEIKQGFNYIDIKWKSNNASESEYSTVNSIMTDENHLTKILGEAGCGKTTILKQLVYLSAQQYIKNHSSAIPIFIPLINIESDSSLIPDIKSIICHQLNIETNLLESILSLGRIKLYLDGFNEILDVKTKKQVAWSVDELSREYPNIHIFLSDRSAIRSSIDVLHDAVTYKVYPLDNTLKEAFIKNNCTDKDAQILLLDYFSRNPQMYEKFCTPIKIIQLIEYVKSRKNIPVDFDREYIHYILERELIDKKDENVEYLEDFACALALESEKNTPIPFKIACSSLAKCKSLLGYTLPDTLKCLNLMIDMGILTNEEGMVDFKFASYKDYFWLLAYENNLADLLGGI